MKFLQILIVLFVSLASMPNLMAEPVNINTASADEIATALTGIGEKKALAIVEFRKVHGSFQTADDLLQVRGIGENLLQKIRSDVIME